jgi:hypothetical protein
MDHVLFQPRSASRLTVVAAALMLLSLATPPARAATDTVDFVTLPNACKNHLDDQGNGRDPQLQAGTTKIELWSDFIENASSVSVDAPVTASLGVRRNGAQNFGRGCPTKGSVEVTVTSPKTMTADALRVLTIRRSDNANVFQQQIKVKAIPQFDLTFRGGDALSCLAKTGSAQFLDNNKRLQIQLPPGHLTDSTNCAVTLQLDVKIPAPVPVVQATDDYSYTLSSTLAQQTLVAGNGGAAGVSGPTGIPLRLNVKLTSVFTPVANPPAFFTSPAPQFMSVTGFVPLKGIQIPLNIAAFRGVRAVSKLTITATATNGLTSAVTIEIIPAPAPSGITSAAASPAIVDVSNTVDITTILANAAPAGGEAITFKVTTESCFVDAATSAALPVTRGVKGVGVVTIPAGAGAVPGYTLLTMRANNTDGNCVGVGTPPTSASQHVDLFVGDYASDPTVLAIPVGPNHVVVPFTIRKLQ